MAAGCGDALLQGMNLKRGRHPVPRDRPQAGRLRRPGLLALACEPANCAALCKPRAAGQCAAVFLKFHCGNAEVVWAACGLLAKLCAVDAVLEPSVAAAAGRRRRRARAGTAGAPS